MRQWVLALPFWLHAKVAFNPELCTGLLRIFIDAVSAWLVAAAAEDGIEGARSGAVTAIQRAADQMRLMPHFHTLFADGVFYRRSPEDPPRFHRTRAPTDVDVAEVVTTVAVRAEKLLRRFGITVDGVDEDGTAPADEALALLPALAQAPTCGRQGAQPRERKDRPPRASGRPRPARCAAVDGYDLHANVVALPQERGSLERLARYILRPPVPEGRLRLCDDGRVEMTLRRPARDGATAVVFRPRDFLARLCAILPPPWFNQVRYHGVFAAHAAWRADVVPKAPKVARLAQAGPVAPLAPKPHVGDDGSSAAEPTPCSEESNVRPRRLTHQQLLARVWDVDVAACPKCGGHMDVISVIMKPDVIQAIAACLGVPDYDGSAPARGPPAHRPLFSPELIRIALRLSAA